jgi:hypothetical protein
MTLAQKSKKSPRPLIESIQRIKDQIAKAKAENNTGLVKIFEKVLAKFERGRKAPKD